MAREILTVREVSEMTRTPPGTLRWWRHCGMGPRSFKIGRRVAYYADDVEKWISTQYESGESRGGAA